jgi:hypothetical protein
MTRLILLAVLLGAYAPISAHADTARWCNGVLTTNGVCIGSESNVPPPTIDCRDQNDSRCWRRQR